MNVAASKIWAIVRDFAQVDRWVIDLTSCIPEGNGVGMRRHLKQKDGARVLEQLDELDETSKTIRYHILESDPPFASYSSTIEIRGEGPESCVVKWTSTLESRVVDADQLLKMLKTNYLRYLEALENLGKSPA